MVKRIGTARRKTRQKLSRSAKDKGRLFITAYMQEFKVGERVVLKADSSHQKGMYFPRYHGKSAIVKAKQGKCYVVVMKDGKKDKDLIVHPVHLKKV